jgi:hypothetical protein
MRTSALYCQSLTLFNQHRLCLLLPPLLLLLLAPF